MVLAMDDVPAGDLPCLIDRGGPNQYPTRVGRDQIVKVLYPALRGPDESVRIIRRRS
jgi:hypothetical protein